MVRTQPVGESGIVGAISHISFPTPSCDDVLIKGSTGPVCPTKGELNEPTIFFSDLYVLAIVVKTSLQQQQ